MIRKAGFAAPDNTGRARAGSTDGADRVFCGTGPTIGLVHLGRGGAPSGFACRQGGRKGLQTACSCSEGAPETELAFLFPYIKRIWECLGAKTASSIRHYQTSFDRRQLFFPRVCRPLAGGNISAEGGRRPRAQESDEDITDAASDPVRMSNAEREAGAQAHLAEE